MGENKSEGSQKQRTKYKPPMGCLAKIVLTVVIIGVVLIVAMAIHFWYLKRSDPALTLKDYLTFTYENTKMTVTRYKDKLLEWKDWLVAKPGETPAAGGGSGSDTTAGSMPEPTHPEFQAAQDELRAATEHLQKGENNEAYERSTRAQDHLEKYKKINPNDPRIEPFERELTKCIHAALKGSKVPR